MTRGPYRKRRTMAQQARLDQLAAVDKYLRYMRGQRQRLILELYELFTPFQDIADAVNQSESSVREQVYRWVRKQANGTYRRTV